MKEIRMIRGAKTLVETCTKTKQGESVLIVTDSAMATIADVLAIAAYERDAEPTIAFMMPREFDGQEPPKPVAVAMREADVVFTPVSKSITHTRSVQEAIKSGARILIMTDFTEDLMIGGGIEADFRKQAPICRKLAQLFSESKIVRITTPAGTNLTSNVEGRKGLALTGIADKPGQFATAVNIEANVGPIEGSSEGIIVADASVPYIGIGVLKEPIKCTVNNGMITKIEGGTEAKILRANLESTKDPNVFNVAEIGVGLNPKARMIGIMLEDEGVYGSLHIGIGTNITFGGTIKAAIHYDLLMWNPTIELDDTVVMKIGKIVNEVFADVL